MSRVMRKPAFCICENTGADQLLSFCYIDSTVPLNLKFQALCVKPGWKTWIQFSHDVAHFHIVVGVQVLPTLVGGEPPSPRSPDLGILSDEDERHRKVKDKKRQHSKKHHDKDKENRPLDPQGGWKVKETTQWQYPDEWRIADVCELQLLDDFINLKVP